MTTTTLLPEEDMGLQDDVTRLLVAHHQGDKEAFGELMPLIYEDLRRIARQQLRRGASGQTLNATAVVHEAYFRLVDETRIPWQDRGHFFAIAARSMRRIIIDYARRKSTQKRGGAVPPLELEPERIGVEEQAETLLALDQGLGKLSAFNERLARVAECRLFAGLTEEETAVALAVSTRTVERDWVRARAWLQREIPR